MLVSPPQALPMAALFGGLFPVEVEADRFGGVGVDGGVAAFDVANDAVFVNDAVGAQGPLVVIALNVVDFQDAVGGQHLAVHITEKGKLDVDLFRESGVGGRRVHADPKDGGVARINLARIDSRLDRLELLRSTTGEGENIDGEQDVFLAAKVGELHGFPFVAEQGEVGSGVADFQGEFGNFVFFLGASGEG